MGPWEQGKPTLIPKAGPRVVPVSYPQFHNTPGLQGAKVALHYLHIGVEGRDPHLRNLLFHTHVDFG